MVVLDSWALLAYLKDEASAGQIEEEWLSRSPAICSINLGEALYIRIRDRGEKAAAAEIAMIRDNSAIVDPDWDLVASAARLKAEGGLAYADAFCIAMAERLGAEVWTGDPEIVARAEQLSCQVKDLQAPPS